MGTDESGLKFRIASTWRGISQKRTPESACRSPRGSHDLPELPFGADPLSPYLDVDGDRRVQPADVLNEKLLRSIIAPASWDIWLAGAGLSIHASTRVIPLANAALCLQAASAGLGIAVTQEAYVAGDLATGVLVKPFQLPACSDEAYYLVCDSAKLRTESHRHFVDWLLTTL